MKTKIESSDYSLDGELQTLFRKMFTDAEYNDVIKDVKKAFRYIKKQELNEDSLV